MQDSARGLPRLHGKSTLYAHASVPCSQESNMARVRVPTPLPVLRASRAPIRTNFSALEPRPAVCRQARRRVKGTSSRSREGRKRIRRIRITTHQRPVRGKQDEERATQRLQVSTRNSKKKRERERERERESTHLRDEGKTLFPNGAGGGSPLSAVP